MPDLDTNYLTMETINQKIADELLRQSNPECHQHNKTKTKNVLMLPPYTSLYTKS